MTGVGGGEKSYFGAVELSNIYSDHTEDSHRLIVLVKQSLTKKLLLLLFLMSLVTMLRSEPVPSQMRL